MVKVMQLWERALPAKKPQAFACKASSHKKQQPTPPAPCSLLLDPCPYSFNKTPFINSGIAKAP